jgi:alpha-tubulin suppressor-like RCC1 family protein
MTNKDFHMRLPNCIFRAAYTVLALLLCTVFMRTPAQAAITLNSIAVTPLNPTIINGQSQAFVATGTFSDGSTQTMMHSSVTAISSGMQHSCALLASGTVQCWGLGYEGQLGNGTSIGSMFNALTPVTVSGISTATAIATGDYHSCALLASGSVQCWGWNQSGELGNGTNNPVPTPETVIGISTATAIAAGHRDTCALLASGAVQCWGFNNYGELGNGTTTDSNVPVTVSGITDATAIAVSEYGFSCALLATGTVQCWGYNYDGQLGNGTGIDSPTPVMVSGITNATSITTGYDHACAVLATGTVQCWGRNLWGQLGDGSTSYYGSYTSVAVSGITNAIAVKAGYGYTCALLATGTVQCWGYNNYGQLGNGTVIDSATPVVVSGISNATTISTGNDHSCALLADGAVKCWGLNAFGDLGNGLEWSGYNGFNLDTPQTVPNISTATAVGAGYSHSCALLASGAVQCWGSGEHGQNGSLNTSTTPITVNVEWEGYDLANTTAAIALGDYHSCAREISGKMYCWGDNYQGQLGTPYYGPNVPEPVPVMGANNVTAIATGGSHSCEVNPDGTVGCWGDNAYGQLGGGYIGGAWLLGCDGCSFSPIPLAGISTATSIVADWDNTCALLASGAVQCWGWNNYGQLGDGTTTTSGVPVTVSSISTATAIAVGYDHSCALLSSGQVQCWGANNHGQLGKGSMLLSLSTTPVTVDGISAAVAIAAGYYHTCVVLASGEVQCWGFNGYGQLGNGTVIDSYTPVMVSGISNATAIAGGYAHTCAVLASGEVQCWGLNDSGQLGSSRGIHGGFATPESVVGYPGVQWSSSNPAVASIAADGVSTGHAAGSAIITATIGSINNAITLTVVPQPYLLTLTMQGSGSGTVTGAGTYANGSTATVSATANTGSTFTGWSGPNGAECGTGSVGMTADKSCTATFAKQGDVNGDGVVDTTDVNLVLAARNTPASGPNDVRDVDGDGMITALDARKVTLLCTYPRCATH